MPTLKNGELLRVGSTICSYNPPRLGQNLRKIKIWPSLIFFFKLINSSASDAQHSKLLVRVLQPRFPVGRWLALTIVWCDKGHPSLVQGQCGLFVGAFLGPSLRVWRPAVLLFCCSSRWFAVDRPQYGVWLHLFSLQCSPSLPLRHPHLFLAWKSLSWLMESQSQLGPLLHSRRLERRGSL